MSERERLNKIASRYNIGVTTIAELLQKKDYPLFDVTPNTILTERQLAIIHATYGKMKRYRLLAWTAEDFTDDAKMNRKIINAHGWNHIRNDVFVRSKDRFVFIPVNQEVDHFDYWKVEDIEAKSPTAIDNFMIIKEKLCSPSGSIPITPEVREEKEEMRHGKSEEVFKLKTSLFPSKINTVGSIDLSALNVSTRPQRKTKEERRKEREERKNQGCKNKDSRFNSQDAIREVWQRFVDIQERLIRQRCSPISIDVDSIEIENDKLHVTVDEKQKEQQLDTIFKDKLGAESYDLASGTVLVDENKWTSLDEYELAAIRKTLSENYIELDTTPAINAYIDYGSNLGHSDQMSLDELHQLDSIITHGNLIEGMIHDTVAFISKVSINTDEYLKYLFGDHYVVYKQKKRKQEVPKLIEVFEYQNQYITWETIQKYQDIGLLCKQYVLIFKIHDESALKELKDSFDCWFPNTETFEFIRVFTRKDPFHKDFLKEVNDNIRQFLEEATLYCSENEIEINVKFTYSISNYKLRMLKFQEVAALIASKGTGYSFNNETGAIGIDFNWREQDIFSILRDIEKSIPFITINTFEDHRFKCKVDTRIIGFEQIKQSLEDKYENIDVANDCVNHKIHIKLPYVDASYYSQLETHLEQDLLQISIAGIHISIEPKVEGKIRLNVKYNNESRLEDLADSITDMKKADFGFMLDEKEVAFGKLLKANYPDLVFDIDVTNEEEKEIIIEAFESKVVNTIIPILTGDLEKISRLKDTFTKATTGTELANPRLQRFIFDSSTATKTENIDNILRKDGYAYKELCKHLLNRNINESQKQAILKAIFAEDIAVIQGPPGTGKSTAIAELIWQLVRNGLKQGNKRERILLTSETNLAVDNAISRIVNNKTNLVKPIRLGGEEKLESEGLQFSIDLMKRWVEEGDSCLFSDEKDEESGVTFHTNLILKNWIDNISNRSFDGNGDPENPVVARWQNYLKSPDASLRKIVFDHYVENANVIGATCSSIGDKRTGNGEFNGFTQFYHNFCDIFKQRKGKANIEFTTVIQDESSKATPAELVLPFVYGNKAIVIGDHRQLPPMLDKEEFEDTLEFALKVAKDDEDKNSVRKLQNFVENHFEDMEISHFQRLYENIDDSLKGTFNLQYRMHPDINEVIEQFYRADGGLRCGLVTPKDLGINDHDFGNPFSRYHGLDIKGLIGHKTHVLFIDSSSPEMMDGYSRVNYGEVETIDKLLTKFENSDSFQRYLEKFDKDEDKQIGIISFYGKQIKQLQSIAFKHSSLPIRVSTVDRFQGMERNIVIVSMVRSNIIQSSRDQKPDKKRYPELGYPVQKSLGFAQSPNRLNVALSRAKRLLIIVGNQELFSSLDIYQRLFTTIKTNSNNRILKQDEV